MLGLKSSSDGCTHGSRYCSCLVTPAAPAVHAETTQRPAAHSCLSLDLQQYTCLLIIKEAAVNAAWNLVTSIKHNIIFHILIVIPCITAITVRQIVYLAQIEQA